MNAGPQSDGEAIRRLAADMASAELRGDADFLRQSLAPDIVIMPPGMAPLQGIDACAAWMGQVLDEVRCDLSERDLAYTSIEVNVSGDWAFERGSFTHMFTWRATGERGLECGNFLRIYSRAAAGSWEVARIIWTLDCLSEDNG